jgi:TonB family protein
MAKGVLLRLVAFCLSCGISLAAIWLCSDHQQVVIAPNPLPASASKVPAATSPVRGALRDDCGCFTRERPQASVVVCPTARAVFIPKPIYPERAKQLGITGRVIVSVLISQEGTVVWARIEEGDPMLAEAVRQVACNARFQPAVIGGVTVLSSGVLTFNFVPSLTEPPN